MAVAERYILPARLLHWGIAVLVVLMFALGLAMTRGPLSIELLFAAYHWHKSLGALVWLGMLLRIGVRCLVPPPQLPADIPQQQLVRHVHALLYILLVMMPVTGWLMVSASPLPFPVTAFGIDLPQFAPFLSLPDAARARWFEVLKVIHSGMAVMLAALVVLHVAGAWRHGDRVRQRMSLRRQTKLHGGLVFVIAAVASTASLAQATSKPPIAAAKPTAGFAVAVLAEGFDYSRPGVAARFARDGEGEAIAYDAADDDRRPFVASAAASALIERAPTFVIPIRVDGTKKSWLRAIAFLKQLPARVTVVLAPIPPDLTDVIVAEINSMSNRLFLLPAGAGAKQAAPNALTIAALPRAGDPAVAATHADLVLAPATAAREAPGAPWAPPASSAEAALMAAGLFGCIDVLKARGPTAVASIFIAKGQRGLAGSAPILEVCAARP